MTDCYLIPRVFVAQVFTEDHAALTGAREVVFVDELAPEKSWNVNLNYVKKFYFKQGAIFDIDFRFTFHDFSGANSSTKTTSLAPVKAA